MEQDIQINTKHVTLGFPFDSKVFFNFNIPVGIDSIWIKAKAKNTFAYQIHDLTLKKTFYFMKYYFM